MQEALKLIKDAHGPESQPIQWHAKKLTGELFWAEVSLRHSVIGGKERTLAVVRDVDARKRMEQELHTRSAQLLANLENTPNVAVQWLDNLGKVIYWNPASEKIFGWSSNEAIGRSIEDLYHDANSGTDFRRILDQIKRIGKPIGPIESDFRSKSGKSGWIISTTFPLPMGENNHGFVCMNVEITARKRIEEELRESEELYRKLVTTIPDMIVRTDLEGNIVFLNETAGSLFGNAGSAETTGRSILSFVSEKDRNRLKQDFGKMLHQRLGAREYALTGAEGKFVDCEMTSEALRNNDGTPFGMVFMIRDLTEKKKMQAQLAQSQKMEAIGRLAGGVAHDYNNMIGVILGYASLIENELTIDHPAHSKIKSVISAAERSADLTKQLLAFSRQQVIAPVTVNLNGELNSLKKMLGRLIGEHIALTFSQSPDLWNMKIDPTQLTQILTNLATNARDAIENVGTISIRTENAHVVEPIPSEEDDIPCGDFVMLSFSDSGGGMDEKTMSQIFEPFFTTKPADRGTGLGLATVFGIVKQNKGYIIVHSELGHGTDFKLYFPRIIQETESLIEEYINAQLNGTETILLVEDEENLLALSRSTLEMHGYNVLPAQSPPEALDICEKYASAIDLLITDVIMPGMNGKELKALVEKVHPGIKSMFISGYTSDIVSKLGVIDEGLHFLQKPFKPNVLLKRVREILNQQT